MEDNENKNFEEIEQVIKAQFDAIELESAEETLAAIKPRLKKKQNQNKFKSHKFLIRFISIAASIIILISIGLSVWLTQPDPSIPPPPTPNTPIIPDLPTMPDNRYEELDIDIKPCEKSAITKQQDLYIPDLDILFNVTYLVGEHKETFESVYFVIEGYHVDNDIGRKITLTIILQTKYEANREEQYNTDNIITVSNQEISVFQYDNVGLFKYKLGFKKGLVRYYIDYQTSSENDIETFMKLFLK